MAEEVPEVGGEAIVFRTGTEHRSTACGNALNQIRKQQQRFFRPRPRIAGTARARILNLLLADTPTISRRRIRLWSSARRLRIGHDRPTSTNKRAFPPNSKIEGGLTLEIDLDLSSVFFSSSSSSSPRSSSRSFYFLLLTKKKRQKKKRKRRTNVILTNGRTVIGKCEKSFAFASHELTIIGSWWIRKLLRKSDIIWSLSQRRLRR